MIKKFSDYLNKYGDIPKDIYERFGHILSSLKINKKEYEKLQKSIKILTNIKWDEFNFVFYFIPQATPRARFSRRTRAFYVKNLYDYNSLFKEFLESTSEMRKIITTSCKFYCDLYFPVPEQMNKVDKILSELRLIRPISKPDWDNAGKTYSDMVQKHLILDDCLIIEANVRKFYSFKPRIEISVKYMDKYDCKYNKRKIESWNTYKASEEYIDSKDSII